MTQRPALFIGSSVEGLSIAYAIQENLEFDCEPTVWSQGIFQPTSAALNDLYRTAGTSDFAVFAFTPDDVAIIRGEQGSVARDNVIFELGLFIGVLSPSRCFFAIPREADLHLPTDLIGIEPLRYMGYRSDGNLLAALGPACNRIRHAIRTVASVQTMSSAGETTAHLPTPQQRAAELAAIWNGPEFSTARARLATNMPLHASEDADGSAAAALGEVFRFLNSVADGVLTGTVDAQLAKNTFGAAMIGVWDHAFGFFVPAGADVGEAWNPPPAIAELASLWRPSIP